MCGCVLLLSLSTTSERERHAYTQILTNIHTHLLRHSLFHSPHANSLLLSLSLAFCVCVSLSLSLSLSLYFPLTPSLPRLLYEYINTLSLMAHTLIC